jgi:L-alanine-DL-glutamate epimerase-like enolase superfamily enzyme
VSSIKSPGVAELKYPRFRIRAAKAWLRKAGMRFPFRFGKVMMTELPVVTLQLTIETHQGQVLQGYAASGFPPMWFDKREGRSLDANADDLLASVREACEAGLAAGFATAYTLHEQVQSEARRILNQAADPMPPLAAGFGPAVFEAALVDAICRHHQKPFHELLRADVFGFAGAGISLEGLPAKPSDTLHLRHTVGMGDALDDGDLAPGNPDATLRKSDGLPQTLTEVVETYAPRYFKVKIGLSDDATHARLKAVARCLNAALGTGGAQGVDYKISLDGNEAWSDASAFLALWKRLQADPALAGFMGRILYVEQPVRRETALLPEAADALKQLSSQVPLLLDEGDGQAGDPEKAFALGYTGISVKTCKSLFRAVHTFSLVAARKRQGLPGFLSSEDLTTVPVLPLQQDLALAAALGLTHSERNGHHFVKGGLFLTEREGDEALTAAPSLYEKDRDGVLRVRIANGVFDLTEVNARGLGGTLIPDTHHQQTVFALPS